MNNKTELILQLPGHSNYLPVAIAFVRQSAVAFGFVGNELEQINLATEEAISNIMRHSLHNNIEESFSIICRERPTAMEIVIHDQGEPFSPEALPEYNPAKLATTGDVNGLGLFLLKQAVDELIFKNLGRNGHETLLIKYRRLKHIDSILSNEATPVTIATTAPLTDWQLRAFIPSDALEISRCAYRTYGYTYEPYIYYPEKIIEMNATGKLQSTVAVDQHGNLLAHMALKFYHSADPIAEIGVAFVKPQYRKHGIFSKLSEFQYDLAREKGLYGIYARAVTSHAISQHKLTKSNFTCCAILLGLFPSDVDFKKLSGKISQKESAVLAYLSLNQTAKRQIYPPAHHKSMIMKIFTAAAITVATAGTTPQIPPALDSSTAKTICMSYNRMEVFNTADIYCFVSNATIIKELVLAKKRLCLEHTDVLYLYLNLEDPGTPELTKHCETLGFFFAGILPYGLDGHHALILQYLNNLAIDFEKIKLDAPFAYALLDYIK